MSAAARIALNFAMVAITGTGTAVMAHEVYPTAKIRPRVGTTDQVKAAALSQVQRLPSQSSQTVNLDWVKRQETRKKVLKKQIKAKPKLFLA